MRLKTTMIALLLLPTTLAVAACSRSPNVTGNQLGGVMPWSGEDESDAFKAAQEHCQKFGKNARVTQITPASDKAKGAVVFNCE